MKPIAFFLFVLFFSESKAQQNLIKYDLLTGKTVYFSINKKKDTAELPTSVFRKPGAIELQIENYNPFYWNAKITTYKKPADEEVGFTGLFNPINAIGKNVLKMLPSLIPDIQLPETGSRGFNGSAEQIQFIKLASKFKTSLESVDKLVSQYEEYKSLELQLTSLKFDHTKTENQVKEKASEIVKKVMDNHEIDIENVITKSRELDNEYSQNISSLKNQYEELKRASEFIDTHKVIFDDQTGDEILAAVQQKNEESETVKQGNINFTNELLAISTLYKEIINTKFKYSYIITNSQDISDIQLNVFAKNGVSNDTVVKYFSVNNSGNLRVRNTISMCFSHFNENNRSYFIKNDSKYRRKQG